MTFMSLNNKTLNSRRETRQLEVVIGTFFLYLGYSAHVFETSTPLFPSPPLVSPKFPHVPLGVGGWPLGCEDRRCWVN